MLSVQVEIIFRLKKKGQIKEGKSTRYMMSLFQYTGAQNIIIKPMQHESLFDHDTVYDMHLHICSFIFIIM